MQVGINHISEESRLHKYLSLHSANHLVAVTCKVLVWSVQEYVIELQYYGIRVYVARSSHCYVLEMV